MRVALVSDNDAVVMRELAECVSIWRQLGSSVPQTDQIQQALQACMHRLNIHYASLSLHIDPSWSVSCGAVENSPIIEQDIIIEQISAGKLAIASRANLLRAQTSAIFLAECIATAVALLKHARENDRLLERLAALNRNQNEFIRIVSHDLRSPLTSMRGYAEMLELGVGGELNERQRQFTEKITAGIMSMTAIVENIQDAGRFDPETGFYETSRDAVDIGEVVGRVVHSQLIPAEKQDLSISIWIADDLPIINADVNMLERAITNLVDNAIKYTPNGGTIAVNVSRIIDDRHGDHVRISVQDNGLGISEEDQQKLFQRHVRLARQDQKQIKGTGLGLFIVRSVAQRHGGEAWVESEPGKGSTFHISIPLAGPNLLGSPRSNQR